MQKAPRTFQDLSAPKAYVAGLGRGAAAFQTSAQYGSIASPSFGVAPAGYVAGAGRGIGGFGEKKPDASTFAANSGEATGGRFDKFAGYQANARNNGAVEYSSEDQFADAVYADVEALRQKKKKPKQGDGAASIPSSSEGRAIADNFADLTSKLKQMEADEWFNIPEAHSKVRKKARVEERFMPVSDSLLSSAAEMATAGSKREDITGFSAARDQRLRVNLDRIGDSVAGQTVVDPRGVLTALNADLVSASQLGDVKKARLLLKSVTTTNPTHGPGWIAAARVEEMAGRITVARTIMAQAREVCSDQEDVWIESARIEDVEDAKAILALAVARYIPKSVSLWLAACDLEITLEEAQKENVARTDVPGVWLRKGQNSGSNSSQTTRRELFLERAQKRKSLLMNALARIPESSKLWMNAYAFELDDTRAKVLLDRASTCCPDSVDFPIGRARLELLPEGAQKLLNDARKRFPGETRIWICACRLIEESSVPDDGVLRRIEDVMRKAITKVSAHVDRSGWLKHARDCEAEAYPVTCEAILRTSLMLGVEEQDIVRTWTADAQTFEKNGDLLCSRIVLDMLVERFQDDEDIWFERVSFAKRQGQNAVDLLRNACNNAPDSQVLWLMYAKEKWTGGDLAGARLILEEAFSKLGSAGEDMWFAAAKLAQEISLDEARQVLFKARQHCGDSERVWVKSIVLERRFPPHSTQEQALIEEALVRFPKSEKLWLMLGQVLETRYPDDLSQARSVYQKGIDACSGSKHGERLWLALARVDENANSPVTARAILSTARTHFPSSNELWLASVRLEQRAKQPQSVVDALLMRGLQACPNDGLLLAELIETTQEAKKESTAKDAFERTGGKDARVVLATARIWWRKRPMEASKVQKWIERAISLNTKFGDAWGTLYRFVEERKGDLANVISRCNSAQPTHGERWVSISKRRGNEDLTSEQILKAVAKISGPDDYVV